MRLVIANSALYASLAIYHRLLPNIFTFSTCNYADQIKPVDPTYTSRIIVHGCLLQNFEILSTHCRPTPVSTYILQYGSHKTVCVLLFVLVFEDGEFSTVLCTRDTQREAFPRARLRNRLLAGDFTG